MSQAHLDAITAMMREFDSDWQPEDISVEQVLAIGDEWAAAVEKDNGTIDDPEFGRMVHRQFLAHGPSVIERRDYLFVVGGEWKYPIYFRFVRKGAPTNRVLCPYCGSQPGSQCITAHGNTRKPHATRKE